MNSPVHTVAENTTAFFSLIKSAVKFQLFLLQKLPAAYFSGLKVLDMQEHSCTVSVPFKWFTKNPFRSTYFACLSMAAEMSTGLLAMSNVYNRSPKVSMLVVAIEGKFYKKAVGVTQFVCKEGDLIRDTVQKAIDLSEAQSIKVL